ncbi:TPA: hypothetical protein ACX6QF_001065 [Photobacterium damselae]|uniref:Uncharacterized protein n=3 Tax=Photobacterium damselae TaxID=38293 RepID=A0A4S2JJR5_PHODD|nr:hypothetical protein [Photobacterium damselae]AWK82489.1 hypothetical protein BST98_10755 [Photobacterium damselae]EHA1081561.1 hypothetical protein [Photobacterium damselae]ELI6446861.1 hypothetical protein [Photobacterium damselae]ELI6450456.1 hypothetical protein [Photobacterium damselae]ELV7518245.1 hypothetical protein [Photobacterium damselae]
MNDWGKGLVLFSAFLSPLAMADWLLDVHFEMTTSDHKKQTVNTSLSLLPGEETVIFDSITNEYRDVVGSAELLEVSADEVKIAFKIRERLDDGGWRTIISPTISTGLNGPTSFECIDDALHEQVKLQVEVMTA